MSFYRRPYVESSVFIAWIKGEMRGPKKDQDAKKIFDTIVQAAEEGVFPIVTSTLTIAEVYKKKEQQPLTDTENENLLPYFREQYISLVEVDRDVSERANELCRTHKATDKIPALRANDAIHIACAEKAECDVILSYDGHFLNQVDLRVPAKEPEPIEASPPKGTALKGVQEPLSLPSEEGETGDQK